jgi:hypothetical protein
VVARSGAARLISKHNNQSGNIAASAAEGRMKRKLLKAAKRTSDSRRAARQHRGGVNDIAPLHSVRLTHRRGGRKQSNKSDNISEKRTNISGLKDMGGDGGALASAGRAMAVES